MTLIRTVAVIGAGPAGRDFALLCAAAGFAVVLEDVMPANLRRAQDEVGRRAPQSGNFSMRFVSTVEDAVREADVAVDFLPDELESKLEIFSMLDRMAPPRTLLCTPTRTLSITDLASCTYRPELCFGLSGADRGTDRLTAPVQVLRSCFTSAVSLHTVLDWLAAMEMKPAVCDDPEPPVLIRNAVR